MKILKLIIIGIILSASGSIQAQVSVNINLGAPPLWGPVGYPQIEYYYLPDVQAYYDVRATQFIYYGNGAWIRSGYLPRQYRNYDLYSGYKVVLNNYHGRTPYANFKNHKAKYYRGYNGGPQKTIGSNNGNHNHSENHNSNGNNGNNGSHGNGKGNRKH